MGVESRSLKELFLAALDVAPADRARWLQEACQHHPMLLGRLERMLAAHDAPRLPSYLPSLGGILPAVPPWGAWSAPDQGPHLLAEREAPGTMIGPYELLQQIGEGGMGTVWLALQTEPVPRQAALKILRPGLCTRQFLSRFEAERHALALMDHPNIARILDAGRLPDGRPYLVMELVRGRLITAYCDEHRLTTTARLEMFTAVCQAVQHAHQKGVIHRDLKPNNVLVASYDGRPVPKVIDFGVAKSTGLSLAGGLATSVGTVVGTPEYMSPEQATLDNVDVDTRSDVYSLGAMLYELLTGAPPFWGPPPRPPLLDLLRRVREEDPPSPSQRLREESDLAGLAAARGAEPAGLLRAVRGDLDRIVMKALEKDRARRYQSAGELAADVRRFLSDEPILARLPSLGYRLRKLARRHKGRLAVGAALALGLLVATAGVGWSLRDRAARRDDARRERDERAARREVRAELALADVDRLVRQQKWEAALAAARVAEASVAEGEPDDELRAKAASAVRDLDFVDRLDEIRRVASAWKEGGFDFAGADRAYREAFRSFGVDVDSLSPADAATRLLDNNRIALPVAVALDDWCFARRVSPGAVEVAWRPLAELANRLDPDPPRVRLRQSWGQKVTPALQRELRELTGSLAPTGQSPATLTILASTLGRAGLGELQERVLRQAQQEHPDDFWVNLNLANVLNQHKKAREGVQFTRAAVALRPTSTAARNNLGSALLELGSYEEAAACFRQAVTLDPRFFLGHRNLARALEQLDDLDGATASLRNALELQPGDAAALDRLARILTRQGKPEEALACLRMAVEANPRDALCLTNLGVTLAGQGKLDEAIACYRKAIKLDPKNATAHTNLGNALYKQGKPGEAADWHRKAIALEPNLASAHNSLAGALASQGKLAEAVASWRKAAECDPKLAVVHKNLGRALVLLGDLDGAVAAYRKAVELDPKDGATFNNLAFALLQQGHGDEAVTWFRKAVAAEPKAPRGHYNLGFALAKQGQRDEALACYREALDLVRLVVKHKPTPASLETLAEAASRCEKWREAVEARQQMARLRPPDPADKLRLAMAHWRAGDRKEARRWHAEAAGELAKRSTLAPGLADLKKEADALLGESPSPSPTKPAGPRQAFFQTRTTPIPSEDLAMCRDTNPPSRRDFVATASAAGLGALAVPGLAALAADDKPADLLKKLQEGNKRFVEGKLLHPGRTPKDFQALAEGQKPLVGIVGCADSRVPPEVVFDQGVGDLFVVRVAGNIVAGAGPLVKGSVEFAVGVLGVRLLLVLGHTQCGAVKAAIEHIEGNDKLPGAIGDLIDPIRPIVRSMKGRPGDKLEIVTKANVAAGVKRLQTLDPILAKMVKSGELKVAGGVYDLATGKVEMVA